MSTALTHPLVAAYLDGLDAALAGADPQERADVLASVREHLADALAGDEAPSAERVRTVLDELGSVEQIAAAASPGASPVAAASTGSAPEPADASDRSTWLPGLLLALAIVSFFLPLVGTALALGALIASALLLRGPSPRRPVLKATLGVSIASLAVNVLVLLGLFSFMTFTTSNEPAVESGHVEQVQP